MTDVAEPSATPPPATGRRALGDILVQVVGRLANGLLGVVVMILVARTLGDDDFGRWSTLLTIIALANPLTELGVTQVAVTRAAEEPEREASWLGALLALRAAMAVVSAAICLGAVLLLGDQEDMRVAGALLTLTVLLAAVGSFSTVFQLRMRNDLTVVVITANSLVWTAAVAAVAATDGGLVALAVAFLAAAVVSLGLQVVLGLRHARISLAGWRGRSHELLRVGLPLSISTLVVVSYVKIDSILVFTISGGRAAGLYGAAYRILEQAIVIPISVTTTLYPLLVRAHAVDGERLRFLLQRALEVLGAVSLGALAFAIPCGGDAMALLFGEEFRASGGALAILMGVFGLTCLSYLNGSLVLLLGLQKRGLVFAMVGLAVNLGLNFAFIPRYGFMAAAWATLATELVVVGLTGAATLSTLRWRPDLGVVLRAGLAAALTSTVLAVLRGADVPIGLLLGLTPLLYGGALVLLGGVRLRETLAVLRPEPDA